MISNSDQSVFPNSLRGCDVDRSSSPDSVLYNSSCRWPDSDSSNITFSPTSLLADQAFDSLLRGLGSTHPFPIDSLDDVDFNATTSVGDPTVGDRFGVIPTVLLGLLAGSVSLITIAGNLVVIASFILERTIRQATNYFIASLAVSDLLIGSVSMPLYTVYLLSGKHFYTVYLLSGKHFYTVYLLSGKHLYTVYLLSGKHFYTVYLLSGKHWPLGEVLCDLWLSVDYTVCLVSIYTVFCITIDRFCSVRIPAKYRNWRTDRKVLIIVGITWIVPIVIFFTSINGWQYFVDGRTVPPGKCYVQYMEDAIFNMLLQFGYFWITLTVMCSLYAGIYRVALRLQRKSEAKHRKMVSLVSAAGSAISKIGIGVVGHHQQVPSSVEQLQLQQHQLPPPSNGYHADGISVATDSNRLRTGSRHVGCATPEQIRLTAVTTPVADHNSRASGTPMSVIGRHPLNASPPSPDKSSSSVALSSDSDGAGGLRSASSYDVIVVNAEKSKPVTTTGQTKRHKKQIRLTTTSTPTHRSAVGIARSVRGSPVDAIDHALRYVNARPQNARPQNASSSHVGGDDRKRCLLPVKPDPSSPHQSTMACKATRHLQPDAVDCVDGVLYDATRLPLSRPRSCSKSIDRPSVSNCTLETSFGVGHSTSGAPRHLTDDPFSNSVSRHKKVNTEKPVWKKRCQTSSDDLRYDLGPGCFPSPVWVRRAHSQGVIEHRSPLSSPPVPSQQRGEGTSSAFSCEWATCHGGLAGIQRRYPRPTVGVRGNGANGTWQSAKSVNKLQAESGSRSRSDVHADCPFSTLSGNFSTTSLMTFDFRAPFITQQHAASPRDDRNRSRPSGDPLRRPRRHPSSTTSNIDQRSVSRQDRKLSKATPVGEDQPRRKLKRARLGTVDGDATTRSQAFVVESEISTITATTKRKPFFLGSAAAAFRNRLKIRSSSSSLPLGRSRRPDGCRSEAVVDGRSGSSTRSTASKTENRALKALRTITIILGAFVLCFTPWHVLSLIMGFCSDNECVSNTLYDISYWLCYLNSPLNPFCYAFANQQFKKTFLRIIRLDWHRT